MLLESRLLVLQAKVRIIYPELPNMSPLIYKNVVPLFIKQSLMLWS